jgi:DNA mismatch repair protein MutL
MDILDEMLTKERTTIKDIEERFIATVACKAAVKANMDLVEDEVHKLLDRLLKLKNPYTCPHGRPTTVKLGHIENGELKS